MNQVIKKNHMYFLLIYVLFFLIGIIFLETISSENVKLQPLMLRITVVVSTELFMFCIISSKICGTIVNFAVLFQCVLFVFSFGQVVVVGLGLDEKLTIYLRYFTEKENYYAFKNTAYAYGVLGFGSLIGQAIHNKCRVIEDPHKSYGDLFYIPLEEMRMRAIVLIVATFPVKCFIDITSLIIQMLYTAAIGKNWKSRFPDMVITYGNFSIIGIGLLLISLRNRPRKQVMVYILSMSYLILTMMGGSRSETVSYILIVTLIFFLSRGKKIRFSVILKVGVAGYFFLTILSTIVYARTYKPERNVQIMLDTFMYCLTKKNIIVETLRDYGTTGYTVECVLVKWLIKTKPSNGMSYIGGLASIFPNIGGIFGKITRNTAFAFALQENNGLDPRYYNIGGSMLGELFFNFGVLGGICASIIIGIMIGKIAFKVNRYLEGEHIDYRIVYYIAAMSSILYWIRDYFGGQSREIVWSIIACWILMKIRVYYRGESKNGLWKKEYN